MNKLLPFLLAGILASCGNPSEPSEALEPAITPSDIKKHTIFLADDSLRGRATGSPGAAKAAHYIAKYFRQVGLQPAGDAGGYYQEFTVNLAGLNNPHGSHSNHFPNQKRIARNIIGLLEGTRQPQNYLVIGAHFDHLGRGKFDSLSNRDSLKIHQGVDDNASGVSGLLELAQYFSRHPPHKSMLFIAFSAKELGLLGSQYFVAHPTIPIDSIRAMINLDMIGRLRHNKLLIAGTGSAPQWNSLIAQANTDSLAIETIPGSVGASDHVSFYYQHIPVLHYFTNTSSQYHHPTDDIQTINFQGEDRVLEHLKRLIIALDQETRALTFTN